MSYPLTSIIILTKNNIQFTERCIFSIYEYTDPNLTPYEIIILDENSIDGTKEFCELHRNRIQYHNVPEYKTFASRNNYGAKIAKGKFLWILNNDIELINDNLSNMLKPFGDTSIGAVGSKHLFPDGSLNHIGMAIGHDLNPTHIFPHEDPKLPYIDHGRFIDLLTSASLVIRKDIFDQIGGYDEDYTWGYEDVDLCFKLKEAGYRAYCDNVATMIHHGQSTHGRKNDDDKNRGIFIGKWKDKLKPNIDEIYEEKKAYLENIKLSPKQILKGALKGSVNLIRSIKPGEENEDEVPYSPIYLFKSPAFTAFRKIADDIEYVMNEKHVVINSVEDLKRVKFGNRRAMLLSTTHFSPEYLSPAPAWIRDYRTFDINYERTTYENSDYWTESLKINNINILASSNYCKEFLLKSGIDPNRVFVVHHGYKKEILNFDFLTPVDENKVKIFAVINTNDEARYGTEYLAEALTKIRQENPDIANKIHLIIKNYGGKPTEPFFKTKEYLDILKAGIEIQYISDFLTDSDMAELYYKSDVFVAPFRGEGFGMKIIDAAAAGLPIISPYYGGPVDYLKHSTHIPVKFKLVPVAKGIDYKALLQDESYVWAEVDSNDLADQIVHSVKNIKNLKLEAIKKRDYIREHFSFKKKWDRIKEIDKEVQNRTNGNENFEFFDAEIVVDKSTSAHEALKDIEQTLIINTIHIDNLHISFEHIEKYLKISDLKGEILIIDDASEGDPAEFLKKYDHFPIRYMKYAKWGGSGFAREIGLRYAKGDNIIIIGDDIKPMPGFFQLHYNFYKEHKEPYVLVGHVEWDAEIRNNPVAEFTTKHTEFQFGFEVIRNQEKIDFTKVVTPNISFRKSDIFKLKQHFKTGLILHEDTIWGKELQMKGVQHYYSRKAYGLHNHQLKSGMTWLDWFTSRSFAIGNNLKAYTLDTSYDEFIYAEKMLFKIGELYGKYTHQELEVFNTSFKAIQEGFIKTYRELEQVDIDYGYEKEIRGQLYRSLSDLYVLNWSLGIICAINKNLSQDIARGLAYAYFVDEKELVGYKYKEQFEKEIGLTQAARLVVSKGRKRFPQFFEPIYKIGKRFK